MHSIQHTLHVCVYKSTTENLQSYPLQNPQPSHSQSGGIYSVNFLNIYTKQNIWGRHWSRNRERERRARALQSPRWRYHALDLDARHRNSIRRADGYTVNGSFIFMYRVRIIELYYKKSNAK